MSRSNYKRGYAFELRVRKFLESIGFFVIRSAGSHGVADLLAFKRGESKRPLMIQCKTDGNISSNERKELWNIAQECNCDAVIASKDKQKKIKLELMENPVDLVEMWFT